MSDQPAPDPGTPTPTGSNLGGSRTPGQLSDKCQKLRDAAVRAIKSTWGVQEFVDIFPRNNRPEDELGNSAVLNLRQISKKVPQLAAARLLMTNECVDTGGRPVRLSFKHTANILAHLKELEAKDEADQKDKIGGNKEAKLESSALGEPVTPTKNPLPGKISRLSKLNAPLPTSHLGQGGKPKLEKSSLVGGKSNEKEITKGLHVPSVKDVAPFSANKPVTIKKPALKKQASPISEKGNAIVTKPSPKKRVSFNIEDELVDETDDLVVSDNLNTDNSNMTTKRRSDGGEEQRFKKLKLSTDNGNFTTKRPRDGGEEPLSKKLKSRKESLQAELNSVKRDSQKDASLTTDQTPSEADTDIDVISVPKSLGDKVAINHGFDKGDKKRKGAGDEGEEKPVRDAIVGAKALASRPVSRVKHTNQVRKDLANDDAMDLTRHPRPSVVVSAAKQVVEAKGKISGSHLDSPVSPKNSVEREENINSPTGRRLWEQHQSKRAKVKGSFSPSKEVSTNSKLNPASKSSSLSTKADQKSSITKKDIMNLSDTINYRGGSSPKDPEEDDFQKTHKEATASATAIPLSAVAPFPRELTFMLPGLPEALNAHRATDRALILSIPGIIKAYLKKVQAALPDGKGPDGDLLSQIIVNKVGYFLEHVDKLDKDLNSLYYQAIDKDKEREDKEREDQKRKDKKLLAMEREEEEFEDEERNM